jgi:murein DD-endopeptidase MepM/ murein hydrolase activator NlpD
VRTQLTVLSILALSALVTACDTPGAGTLVPPPANGSSEEPAASEPVAPSEASSEPAEPPVQEVADGQFELPFPCGQQWRLDTWGHAPALDMVREPDQTGTEGAELVAPAEGVVNKSFLHDNAGNVIQIDHGDDTFSTYLHLESRAVEVGDEVAQGQQIGRVGRTGPTSNDHPHLHFELAVDTNGDGEASWGSANSERVRPTFDGVEYGQANSQTWRNVTSNNSCGS